HAARPLHSGRRRSSGGQYWLPGGPRRDALQHGGASGDQIRVSGNGIVTLTAPVLGTYAGVSIFQDRNLDKQVEIRDGAVVQISGTVYAANAAVRLTGDCVVSIDTLGGAYVCSSLWSTANSSFNVSLGNNRPKVPEVNLVE